MSTTTIPNVVGPEYLESLLHRKVSTIRVDASRRPNSLPPRLVIARLSGKTVYSGNQPNKSIKYPEKDECDNGKNDKYSKPRAARFNVICIG